MSNAIMNANDRGIDTVLVAVTSVGSGIGQSIVDSLKRSGLKVVIVGFDLNPLGYGLYDCHYRHKVPSITSNNYISEITSICEEYDVDILIPALDSELAIFSENKKKFMSLGIEVLVAPYEFVRLCRNKLEWAKIFSEKCTAVLPAYTPKEILALPSGKRDFPLIAKPLDGSASEGVKIIQSEEDLLLLDDDMMVQVYAMPNDENTHRLQDAVNRGVNLQLSELSLQLIFSKDGSLVAAMPTLNKLKSGIPVEVVPLDYDLMRKQLMPLVQLLSSYGARGPVNLQGRLTDEGPKFFEINARFTGITGTRSLFGFNEVDYLVRHWLDFDCSPTDLKVNYRRIGIRQVGMRVVDYRAVPSFCESSGNIEDVVVVGVTGASGYLGKAIIRDFLKTPYKYKIIAYVRNQESARALFVWAGNNNYHFDVAVVQPGREVFNFGLGKVDLLINAASARPTDGVKAIADSFENQANLLHEAETLGVPYIINISSKSIYGDCADEVFNEQALPQPNSPYAMMKLAAESIAERIGKRNPSVKITSLRLARLYGVADGMRWSEVPHAFSKKAFYGDEILLHNSQSKLDILHVSDAARAIRHIANLKDSEWKDVFNVGAGNEDTLLAIAQAANQAALERGGAGSVINANDESPVTGAVICVKRLRNTGWAPEISLKNAFSDIVSELERAGDYIDD